MDFESTAVETTEAVTGEEFAEPQADEIQMEGSNESVVAEQTSEVVEHAPQDSSTNKAFQEMRHRNRELEEELANLKAEREANAQAFSRIAGENASEISVLAELTGMSEEEVSNEYQSARESYEKDARIEALESQLISIEAEKAMAEDLALIRNIDPKITSLEQLGTSYSNYINAGLSAEDAYWAVKSKENATKATPPKDIGTVDTTPADKEYYTQAEIENMSSEELSKNWKKILKSWER